MALKKLLFVVYVITTVCFLVFWAIDKFPNQTDLCNQGISFFSSMDYEGVVVRKFINQRNHNAKPVVLKEAGGTQSDMILDGDKAGIYELIEEGDSLVKSYGVLKVSLRGANNDTIVDFKFACN